MENNDLHIAKIGNGAFFTNFAVINDIQMMIVVYLLYILVFLMQVFSILLDIKT